MKRLLFFIFLLLMLAGCGSGASSRTATTITPEATATPTPTVAPTPPIPNVPARTVHFVTSDHLHLAGSLYGHGKTIVICSHMLGTTRDIWSDVGIPQRLAVQGYEVLTYDFRGNGDSEGPRDIWSLDVDLRAAVAFARQQGATKIVLMGASMGGTASLKVASEEQVSAVISLSGPQSFSVDVSDREVQAMKIPKLFMASETDTPFATDAKHMYAIAPAPKEIYIYPGNNHGTAIFGGDNGDEPAQRIFHFLAQYTPAG